MAEFATSPTFPDLAIFRIDCQQIGSFEAPVMRRLRFGVGLAVDWDWMGMRLPRSPLGVYRRRKNRLNSRVNTRLKSKHVASGK